MTFNDPTPAPSHEFEVYACSVMSSRFPVEEEERPHHAHTLHTCFLAPPESLSLN